MQIASPVCSVDAAAISSENDLCEVDSTQGSLLHLLAARFGPSYDIGLLSALSTAAIGVCLTYVPLAGTALFNGLGITHRLPNQNLLFLYDWNTAFTFLVSFPLLLTMLVRDHRIVVSSLRRVRDDGVLIVSDEAMANLCAAWQKKFRKINLIAQACGIIMGMCIAGVMYSTYAGKNSWMSSPNGLREPVGAVFLWCIFLFYGLIPIYALRCIATSFFLAELVSISDISMLPFHPDRSGGLRPVGEIGLRHQYFLSIIGVNLILWIMLHMHEPKPLLHYTMLALAVSYFVVGPFMFLGPLLPFRAGMITNKNQLMSEVAQRLRVELARLHKQLRDGDITQGDEDIVDRLRKLGAVIEELPIWPFDFGIARKFLTAYVPTLTALVATLAKAFHLS